MTTVGVCHTDLAMRDTWPRQLTPMVFGHEGAGRVEAVGAEVTGLAPGDQVCLTFASCGACEQCAAGHPAYCHAARARNLSGGRGDGTTPLSLDGTPLHAGFFGQSSFATHAVVHERGVVKVPSDLPARSPRRWAAAARRARAPYSTGCAPNQAPRWSSSALAGSA